MLAGRTNECLGVCQSHTPKQAYSNYFLSSTQDEQLSSHVERWTRNFNSSLTELGTWMMPSAQGLI